MFKHWSTTVAMLGAAVAAGLLSASLSNAGKPPPPPPLPPPGLGTVFFWSGMDLWQMASDGSAKSYLLTRHTEESYEPSAMDYAGRRWWLTLYDDGINGYDVFAVRPDGAGGRVWVQLTDVAKDGISFEGWDSSMIARWSNDGADSFVTAVGRDTNLGTYHIWRINISGYAIDADPTSPVVPVTVGDPRFTPIVSENEAIRGGYAVSRDSAKVVYHTPSGVWVKDLSSGGKTPLRSDGDRFDWSPDDSKITFTVDPSVWIMNSDGSGARIVAAGQASRLFPSHYSPRYIHTLWSPDGQWLVFRRELIVQIKGNRYQTQCDIVAIPAAGGQIGNLTGDFADPMSWKLPLAWRPNVPASPAR